MLRAERVGIGLQRHQLARARLDLVFVKSALSDPRDEQLPDAAFPAQPHWMTTTIPPVEVGDDADSARIRRPNREAHSIDAGDPHRMSAELLIGAQMRAFGQQ